jgi:ABC-2 type transport system permease protein
MTDTALSETAPPTDKTLRRLFLTLFLRGRSSRGLKKETAPKSIGEKLALTLLFYALFGLLALSFVTQPVFALSVYLHSMTFMFLGMFVAASAGEVLFNKEEADILLHRPASSSAMLWAKIRVLIEISLWMAGAFNLVGLFAGVFARNGSWWFPLAHALATILEALFCASFVVVIYQLCFRWFGRQRLEGLITTLQVAVSIGAVISSQVLSQMMARGGRMLVIDQHSWWIGLLPPAWFAGIDDAIAGSGARTSWILAFCAVAATAITMWMAFGKLVHDYESGMQTLGETVSRKRKTREGRGWIERLVDLPPLRWWLRDPVERASFLLVAAYLLRDRDVKLRVYPGLAPFMAIPIMFMFQGHGAGHGAKDPWFGGFRITFIAAYVGLVPLLGVSMLQYSQQWQASDIFRAAPIFGPAPLCNGARRAVLFFLTLPLLVIFAALIWLPEHDPSQLLMLIPGVIAIPIYSLVPTIGGGGIPLSQPTEEAKSAGRGLTMIVASVASMALGGLALMSWNLGFFWWLVAIELLVGAVLYVLLRRSLARAMWQSME